VNVSQWPHNEKPFERMVHTRVDRSAWDHRISLNLHALVIYLKLVLVRGITPKRFEECQCEDDDVPLHYQTWVPVMVIIVCYEAQWTPFPWSIELNAKFAQFIAFWIFCSCDLSPLSRLLNCNSLETTQVKMLGSKFDFVLFRDLIEMKIK
jgi:hypothetical protein